MRVGSRMRRVVVALAIGSLLAAACGDDDEEAGGQAEPTTSADTGGSGDERCTEARVGGEATISMVSEPPSMDPVRVPGTGSTGGSEMAALYDTLMRYDSETDEFVPLVAESLEPNDDFSEWTLKLRDGVTFGNGDPLTAEAVKTSFARHQDPANRSAVGREAATVDEMEVVDPQTLVFRLDAPWARFPALLTHIAGMVTNPAVVQAKGADFAKDPAGAGVGPYEVERWVPGEELRLRAKENWWGGPVCIQTLRFVMIPGASAMYEALQNGDIQGALLREAEVIKAARDEGYEGLTWIFNSGRGIIVNHASGPTADLLVRQAVAAALDPDVVDDRAFGGYGHPTTAIIAEESPHFHDGIKGPEPDPDEAKELVEKAKAEGWDGRLELLCQPQPEAEEICLAIKAMMDAAGMQLTVTPTPVNQLIPRVVTERNFQMAAWSFPGANAEPWMRMSASFAKGAPLNAGGYANDEMDAALADLRAAEDEDARQDALTEIQRIWNETLPALIYESNEAFVVFDDSLKGVLRGLLAQIHFDQAYIED